ncbi:hypothetical protein [Okeania sp. SIO2B3]|nr:hypothetical protein [Okeania sp. SIO2B3]
MTDNLGLIEVKKPTFIKLFEPTKYFKLQEKKIMVLPLLPAVE